MLLALLVCCPCGVEEAGNTGVALSAAFAGGRSAAVVATRIATSVATRGTDARHLAGVHPLRLVGAGSATGAGLALVGPILPFVAGPVGGAGKVSAVAVTVLLLEDGVVRRVDDPNLFFVGRTFFGRRG